MSNWDVEDIFDDMDKPKRKKSGQKGKRAELAIVNELNDRFAEILAANPDWGEFSRSVGSGNRWGIVGGRRLSKAAKDTYTGDITCPASFNFVLESKGGYNEIDLNSAFDGGSREINEFLKQVSEDSDRSNARKPLLLWKKDRKPRLAFLKAADLDGYPFEYSLNYRDWKAVLFKDLLLLDDSFFFKVS